MMNNFKSKNSSFERVFHREMLNYQVIGELPGFRQVFKFYSVLLMRKLSKHNTGHHKPSETTEQRHKTDEKNEMNEKKTMRFEKCEGHQTMEVHED